jgi:hypothetical protein
MTRNRPKAHDPGPRQGDLETRLELMDEREVMDLLCDLRRFASHHPGHLGRCADAMADRFVGGGEPWTTDAEGRDLYDFSEADTDFFKLVRRANRTVEVRTAQESMQRAFDCARERSAAAAATD